MRWIVRVSLVTLLPMVGVQGAAAQEVSEWTLSEKPVVEVDTTRGEREVVDPLGFRWVRTQMEIYRNAGVRVGDESPVSPRPRPVSGIVLHEFWEVFDSHGQIVGKVRLPEFVRAVAIGEDFIQGVRVDGSGTKQMRMYSLDRGG